MNDERVPRVVGRAACNFCSRAIFNIRRCVIRDSFATLDETPHHFCAHRFVLASQITIMEEDDLL